jgi:4-aminobutyrate aminotransferase/(S)-3-amino-2-methylpropionate transaminase
MFDWPAAEPPRYKYPLDENVEYNRKQDDDSLKGITDMIDHWK